MCTVMNSVRTFICHITRLDMTGKRVRLPYCRIFVLLMHGGFFVVDCLQFMLSKICIF